MPVDALRDKITVIDRKIIHLIGERQRLASQIAHAKITEGMSVHDPARVQTVLNYAFEAAVEEKIDPVEVQKIFSILIAMSEERQHEFLGEGNLP